MKKIIVFSMMLLAVYVPANAQQQMKVQKTDGTVTTFNVADVTKVYFEGDASNNYITANNVFDGKKIASLKTIGRYDTEIQSYTYNDKGQLTQYAYSRDGESMGQLDMQYTSATSGSYSGTIGSYTMSGDITTNDNYFCTIVKFVENGETNYCAFGYDTNNHLTDYTGLTAISWNDAGDVTKVYDNESGDYIILVYNTAYLSHGLYCADMIGIDLDAYEVLAVAGLLGKAPTHLPVQKKWYRSDGQVQTESYEWTFDDDGYPKTLSVNSSDYDEYTMEIEWK